MDKKDIALTVTGVLASIAVAYFIYRAESAQNAANAQNASDAAAQAELDAEAQQEQQQSFLSSLSAGSYSNGGGATTYTGTGNSTSIDTTATSESQANDNGAGDGFTLSSLLSAYEQTLAATTQSANTEATTPLQPYNPPIETFNTSAPQFGYPTAGATSAIGGGSASSMPVVSPYQPGSNLVTVVSDNGNSSLPSSVQQIDTSKNVYSGGNAPAPSNVDYSYETAVAQ